jgi:hypothetical protein
VRSEYLTCILRAQRIFNVSVVNEGGQRVARFSRPTRTGGTEPGNDLSNGAVALNW